MDPQLIQRAKQAPPPKKGLISSAALALDSAELSYDTREKLQTRADAVIAGIRAGDTGTTKQLKALKAELSAAGKKGGKKGKAVKDKWKPVVKEHLNLLKKVPTTDLQGHYVLGTGDPSATEITGEQLDEHMEAYKKARWYHATSPTAVPSILTGGLDPRKRGTEGGAEAISNPTKVEAAKKDPAVFLGGDVTTTRYYNAQLKQPWETPHLRAFLKPAEGETMSEDLADQENLAYRTPNPVGAQGLIYGRLAEQSPEKLDSIFEIVRQHYPGGGKGVSVEDVKRRHAQAIARGKTTHSSKQKSGKSVREGPRYYQARDDEGYISD